MSTSEPIEANLPLTEVTYFILLCLASGPRHGYAIMKDVQALSGDRVTLSTGTLYGGLKRMLELEWISRIEANDGRGPERSQAPLGRTGVHGQHPAHDEAQTGRVRKAYRLTSLGQNILSAEIQRLKSLVNAASLNTAKGTS